MDECREAMPEMMISSVTFAFHLRPFQLSMAAAVGVGFLLMVWRYTAERNFRDVVAKSPSATFDTEGAFRRLHIMLRDVRCNPCLLDLGCMCPCALDDAASGVFDGGCGARCIYNEQYCKVLGRVEAVDSSRIFPCLQARLSVLDF